MSRTVAYRTLRPYYTPETAAYGVENRNYDYPEPYQGRMVRDQLNTIVENASGLERELRDTDRLPAWVQYKIATGEDRLSSAANYMRHRIAQNPNGVSYGDAAADVARMQDTKKSLTFGMGLLVGAVIGVAILAETQDRRYRRYAGRV